MSVAKPLHRARRLAGMSRRSTLSNQTKKKQSSCKQPRYDLSKLLEQITPDNQPESFDDAPVGEQML